jgi:acyl carrier protein phosphodiesterase
MNFLAHAYLSFDHPQILVGNMISDFVKGAKKMTYQKDIRQGITLHREIDSYTDQHPVTREASQVFRPLFRLYSGPIIDIIYDHFLAIHLEQEIAGGINSFSAGVYKVLEDHSEHLPPDFRAMLYYMRRDDWLAGYAQREGIEKSLQGLARRATYLDNSGPAYSLFNEHYRELAAYFASFFPDVKHFAKQRFSQLVF